MLTALAAGHRALEALDGSGGAVRVIAALSESIYARAGEALVWLGGPRATLHPRAVRVARLPPARTHDTLALDLARSARWEPPASALDARTATAFTTGCDALARDLPALGMPEGLAALLLQGSRPATTEARLLERALPAARALAIACARDDWRGAVDAGAGLVGVGPGLTPSGDDFVGGAFFARVLLARAGLCDRDGWAAAATRVSDLAASRTHPISAALLGDLLRGEGWQPLHDLAQALARADTAAARVAARALVGLGHSSGWDLLAGFVAGAAPGIALRHDPGYSGIATPYFPLPGGPVDPYRLPRDVVPTRYDIRLEPDLTALTFRGEETILLAVAEPVTEIVLNAVELAVDAVELVNDAGRRMTGTPALDEPNERCRLAFAEPVAPGAWRLRLAFRGTLNDKLRGFYRSAYKDGAGTSRTLAATQFEATDARRAFPCWDEPSFKAVFAVTLVIDPALTAVSNTSIVSTRAEAGKQVVRFADTIVMSTYLVAFVVGELEATEPLHVGRTPIRVWCTPGKRRLASFGREIAAASLAFFEDYYAAPYPGDKLDFLAIPDFAAGAMENLGAITFRETALLVDERAASHVELERIADVVAHENAHMWFGDLVTMSWWNGIWLNEAFATFMEMLAVDAWKPEWQRWTTFGVSRAAALAVDGLHSTRPIEFPVRAPREADAMFDVLTYEKGAAVLRMLEQYLGAEVFRAGVRDYLQTHRFGNADTRDLWAALGRAARQPIPEVMDGWIFTAGYPLVSARREGETLVLAQQRFNYLSEPPPPARAEPEPRWQIPVQVRVLTPDGADTRRVLLTDRETRVPLPASTRAVVVNEGGHGFYRARYEGPLRDAIVAHLDALSPIERFNLVNDAWAVTVAGHMALEDYLDLTARFRGERDKNVWSALAASLHSLNRIVNPADRPRLEAFVRDRAAPALADLGWSPRAREDELTGQLRADLVRLLGTLGNDPAVQRRAGELYAAALGRADAVDPNVLPALIAVLAYAGDETRYAEFLERFRAATTPQAEQRHLYALAAFQAAALVEQTLARTVNGEVRTQDAPFVVRAMLMAVHSRELAWTFVKSRWDAMDRLYPKQGLRRMCEGVIGLATPTLEADVHRFFTERAVDLGGKTLQQYLEQLRVAVALREREGHALAKYLARFA